MAALTAASIGQSAVRLSNTSGQHLSSPASFSHLSSFSELACQRRGLEGEGPANARQVLVGDGSLLVEARHATRTEKTKVRHNRIRRKLSGTPERPRLAVFRSNQHIYAQVIDDTIGHTLASSSTLMPNLREELKDSAGPPVEVARRVGQEVAKAALEKGVTKVAFDRGGFIYHGRIKAVADGAREGGLEF
eukprot:TRINITY_DN29756_c0_g1_i1.p1 TRINITY_DN29756_c0_g1~~TRINITY_DN29756_c0_g1_i1.p1  ORF type:complete len:191 (+),score=36.43 TRINITY_DN29756_c0_g1_i1:92-664(+)